MDRVSGWLYDGRRFREGTIGWDDGVIVEVRSTRARNPLAHGLIVPGLWNAHTHLGDAVVTQELRGTIEELVAPPHGLKHRILATAKDAAVIVAMRRAMTTMLRTGTTGFSDFREGGLKGLKLLYAAVAALPIQGVALGRPADLSYDAKEVAGILRASDGIAVSSYLDWPKDAIRKLAAHARREKKVFAIHCSERIREDIDEVLDLSPTFLVHMVHATDADLERCADADVPIVVCPRSNAFFGLTPDIPRMLRAKVDLRLGTDNAMINVPSILREMEFAYRVARMKGGAPAQEIVNMALRGRNLPSPGESIGFRVGGRADLVVFDLPGGSSGFASLMRASASDVRLVVSGGEPWSSNGALPKPHRSPRQR
ncbi:MAG: amidohydrolase family protein, partial [Thermoplasmata archaeon]|nr:amidohydrolase family protein [Thermoplasmata archaeon]